jgi:hypothetical protein
MTSIDDRAMVDEIIAANGDQDTTHIIEYQNMHDGRTAWKLCRSEEMYTYAMETGSFIEPKLIWTQERATMTQNELEAEVVEDDRVIECSQCNETVKPEFSRSGKHIKATCPNCNRYLKFVRQIAFVGKPWGQQSD